MKRMVQPEVFASVTYQITEPTTRWHEGQSSMFISEMLHGEQFRTRRLGENRVVEFPEQIQAVIDDKVKSALRNFSGMVTMESEGTPTMVINKIKENLRKRFRESTKLPDGSRLVLIELHYSKQKYNC